MRFSLTCSLAAANVIWIAALTIALPLYGPSSQDTRVRRLEAHQQSNELEPIELVPKVGEPIDHPDSLTHEHVRPGGAGI